MWFKSPRIKVQVRCEKDSVPLPGNEFKLLPVQVEGTAGFRLKDGHAAISQLAHCHELSFIVHKSLQN